ncbi:efflux transporter outer membrane subunit [Nitrospirillum amazonense]|uniref:Multidrug efflux system outer membrane protein n=1 Tax=Nitrospirillum amazonense TaxID=28077 RepID=A0A560KGI7_9PROT|nr:efflux transporter outer membrane subunit [Nitrospirillum amazonense]MDG3443518.1 efflux transporter outer membrane subunit [Nitrospirillum amazonense]TWB82342.1 multidrug efflux system outer membrane protein [Nitrospirillum amazonense]
MTRPFLRTTTSLLALSLLAGCISLDPDYQRPAAPVPTAWPQGAAYAPPASAATPVAETGWQDFFVDADLRAVVGQALDNNRDLRVAVQNVLAARAKYRVQEAAQLPTVNASASGSYSRTGAGSNRQETKSLSAAVGVSAFEADLFGRVASLTRADLETYLAEEETARATRISLISEVASAYITYAADKSLLRIAQATMESAQHSADVTRKRLSNGVATRLDAAEADTVYQTARADVANYTTLVAQDLNALETLTGGPVDPAHLPDGIEGRTFTLAALPAGISTDVLLNRPDVLSAEHSLKSANANIGAARAAFFPTVSLTTAAGFASSAFGNLFQAQSQSLSFTPSVSVPIFDNGANQANLDYAKATQQAAVATYEKTIQTAFKEVANALARRGTIAEQLDAQQATVRSAQTSYDLSQARYKQGADSYLNALDAQRTLYSAQQTLVSVQLTDAGNLVTLYQVLGGGVK